MQRREKGTGTIVQRDSGTWSGRVSIGRGGDGKIKYKYFSGKTEAEVKKKIREYNKSGCPQDAQQILLKDYLLNWLTNIKRLSLKPSSYDRLESTAFKQVIPRLGDFKISEITPEDISKMMNDIKDEGLSYSSTKKAFDCVNAVMTYAFNKRDILFNPASLALKPNEGNFFKKEIRYFTKEEAALITEECGRKYSTGTPVYPYGDAFILALHTGLRMGELIGLQKSDINFEEKKLMVPRNAQVVGKRNADGSRTSGRRVILSTTKTYSGTRIISLNNVALEAVQRLCDSHPESQNVICGVRGGQVTHERFERSFYRVLDNCGIERTGVHSLRHTFATMALEHGMDVKTLSTIIGHVSSATTLDIYSHVTDLMQQQAAVKIDRQIGKTDAPMPTEKEKPRTQPSNFQPTPPKHRKPGTGCLYQINDHLWEGKYSPKDAQGKRISRNVYAKTREECEERLAVLIEQMKKEISTEKEELEAKI